MQKKVFLIVSTRKEKVMFIEHTILQIPDSKVYTATDGPSALAKIRNDPPHVVLTDLELPKLSGTKLIEGVIKDPAFNRISFIVMHPLPKQELFIDEMVKGRVIYLINNDNDSEILQCLNKAIQFTEHAEKDVEFFTRIISPGEILMKQGDPADFVYILRSGKLRAYHYVDDQQVTLGYVEPGEFVGELAYFNKDCRSATVEAVEPSQLIEIPIGTFDTVLYQRPAWAKSLVNVLSKRLKNANAARTD